MQLDLKYYFIVLKKMSKNQRKKTTLIWIEAEKLLSKDKVIGQLIDKYGSCTIKPSKKSDYFRDIVYSIVGQQLSMKAAESIFVRVENFLGRGVPAKKILETKDEDLRNCGLSFAKIKYLKDLSEKVESGKVEITKMDKLSDEDIVEELIKVKGIGRWTAEMFLMFSLARPDVFPVDDLGIKNGLKKLFNNKQYDRIIGNRGVVWKPYRTTASWYIWKSLE
jgi:DNA-3-methyladenine glycosylase II